MEVIAIVLAAGKGVRMKSDLPKVYHRVCGKPMVVLVLEALKKAGIRDICVIIGYKGELVKQACAGHDVKFVEQKEQLGTGHAVMQVMPHLKGFKGTVLVLNGDAPLIKAATIRGLLDAHKSSGASATILTADMDDPNAYGRIIRDSSGNVLRIVEKKDAGPEELKVKEINTGTYCFDGEKLTAALPRLKNENAQKEYYLTDVISIIRSSGGGISASKAKDNVEVLGVNTMEELHNMERLCKSEL